MSASEYLKGKSASDLAIISRVASRFMQADDPNSERMLGKVRRTLALDVISPLKGLAKLIDEGVFTRNKGELDQNFKIPGLVNSISHQAQVVMDLLVDFESTKTASEMDSHSRKAADHNPDPLTFKAFLSEFKQGEKRGKDLAMASVMGDNPVPATSQAVVAEEKVAAAAGDLLELARRIETIAKQGPLGVNEARLSAKMSGILSTLFYQTGLSRGLKA